MVEIALVSILSTDKVLTALNSVSVEQTNSQETAEKYGGIWRDGLAVLFTRPIIVHILIKGWRG